MTATQLLAGNGSSADRDRPLIVRLMDSLERLDPERLEQVWNAQSPGNLASPGSLGDSGNLRVEQSLIRSGLADEYQIARAYAEHYLLPIFDPPAEQAPPVDARVASLLPENLCRTHLIVPLADDGMTLDVAMFCPDALSLAQDLQSICGRQMRPLFAPLSVIERLLSVLYGDHPSTVAASESGGAQTAAMLPCASPLKIDAALQANAAVTPTATRRSVPPLELQDGSLRYIRRLLKQAFQLEASDIHFEPSPTRCRVRLRIAGALVEAAPPSADLQPSLVSRLKTLAKIDPADQPLPQEGTIRVRSGDRPIDLQVSTCPTVFGDRVVLRVCDSGRLPRDLSNLGLEPPQRDDLTEALRSPHGMLLVSGPPRSGRSTTLYSCLDYLNEPEANICTVENRVELQIPGISQLQTGAPPELTMAGGLRSLLRQDPDVVMVGEICDRETAGLCLQTALSGHFVLSTVHAEDGLSGVSRLVAILGESSLLAETLRLTLGQRLLRRLCTACRTPGELSNDQAQRYGLRRDDVTYRAMGCPECRGTGYRGRLAVFEVIPIGGEQIELIRTGAPVDLLRRSVATGGVQLLSRSVAAKVAAGMTSLEEAMRMNVNGSRVRSCASDK